MLLVFFDNVCYLRQEGYILFGVCLSVCLSVCFFCWQLYVKNYMLNLCENFNRDATFIKEKR